MTWTEYAPLGGEPPPCSFCGDSRDQLTVGPEGVAICLRCAERIVAVVRREPASAPDAIDPRDPGPPIMVRLGEQPLGDLGNVRADARLLLAILLRGGAAAAWLHEQGIDEAAVREQYGALDLGFG